MIWIAGVCLLLGVLLIVVTPLLGSGKNPSFKRALNEQKARIADDLAALGRKRKSGEISEEDFATQQRILETEAVSLLEAEKKAGDERPVESKDRRLAKMLAAALVLVLTADVAAGIYLYKGGWAQLLHGDVSLAGGEREGGDQAAPMGGGGQAPGADASAMVAKLEARLRENPNDAKGQALLGRSYMVMNRYADAVAPYRKAVELEPASTDHKLGLGMALIRARDMDEAKQVFANILKAEPANTDALWFTGMLEAYAKDWKSAEKTWKALVAATPEEQREEMKKQIAGLQEAIRKDHAEHPAE